MPNATKTLTKIPSLVVDSKDPFAGDALHRKELCEKWTNFIEQSTTPYVLAIDGKWGTGKTTLLKMWMTYLNQEGFRYVFFDAWKADFYGEALPALIGEITKQIPNGDFADNVKKIPANLFTSSADWKRLVPAIKMIPGGEAATGILNAFGESLKDHDAVEHYKSHQKSVDKFKGLLKEFASNKEDDRPLVIFIDELDRCRPDFALDVLEKVKHVFDVEYIFFVFAINKEGLSKTITTVYGEIDSERYLRKFFDHTVFLVNKDGLGEIAFAKSGLQEHLHERFAWLRANDEIVENELRDFWQYWNTMIAHLPVSLRDEEQILSTLNISFRAIPKNHQTFPVVLAYFAILKVVNPRLFEECKISLYSNGKISFPHEEFTNFYREYAGFGNPPNLEDSHPGEDENWPIYMRLCAICYKIDEKYKEKVEAFKAGSNGTKNEFWTSVGSISRRNFD